MLVAATVERHGVDGLMLATLMAGVILLAIGFLRLGTYIKYIPYPVTVGFTAGIAVIILASQLKELLGLTLAGQGAGADRPEAAGAGGGAPHHQPRRRRGGALTSASSSASAATAAWPGLLIAVAVAAVVTWLLGLPVETIGTRFGGIPRTLPAPHPAAARLEKALAVLPDAVSFALLGGIESLLSAVVADGMTGPAAPLELRARRAGRANIASALFGGICVTGTIARTATNVRAGAHGPVAGHAAFALFLLLFMLVAAPLAGYIPLAAWRRARRGGLEHGREARVRDAPAGLARRCRRAAGDLPADDVPRPHRGHRGRLRARRPCCSCDAWRKPSIEAAGLVQDDQADSAEGGGRRPYDPAARDRPGHRRLPDLRRLLLRRRRNGRGAALDRIAEHPKAYVIDFSAVPVLDSTAAVTIEGFVRKAHRHGARVYIAGAGPSIRRVLLTHGVRPPRVRFKSTGADAMAAARERLARTGGAVAAAES